MDVELAYGGSCREGFFAVTPECGCSPSTISPEWLLARALSEDGYVRNPGRLALLLRSTPGPYTVAKAAALEPDYWEGILHVSLYTDSPDCNENCACLLPFAPAVSALSALGKRQSCVYAGVLTEKFLVSFVQAASLSGVERLILVNPPFIPSMWTKVVFEGLEGYRAAASTPAPRAFRYATLAGIAASSSDSEVWREVSGGYSLPQPKQAPKMLALAFGEAWPEARALLEEVESAGHILTVRALYEIASTLGVGKLVVRSLFSYGYLRARTGQVELTGKGVYALSQE